MTGWLARAAGSDTRKTPVSTNGRMSLFIIIPTPFKNPDLQHIA
jgi:hypothetical protein